MASGPSNSRHWDTDLHVVLDFYKDDPQRLALHGDVQPNCERERFDTCPYWTHIQAIRDSDQFLEGMLLKSLERGAKYPFLHYIMYNNQSTKQYRRRTEQSPMAENTASNAHLIDIIGSQGGYREMFTFVDHQTPLLPKRPQSPRAGYIISVFKARGSSRDLDKSWSYWSGADLIVENVPPILKLNRLTFHKIKYDLSMDSFAYVLMSELGEAMTHRSRALEFVGTLKDRQCGISSIYAVEHFF